MVKYVDETCDYFFNYFNFGAHNNSFKFQVFLCVLNVLLSVWPLSMFALYSTDVHLAYWLGEVPLYANLAVPVILLTLNLGLNFFQCCTSRAKAARMGCFMLFLAIGGVLMILGLYVCLDAETVAGKLRDECGLHAPARELEAEWQRAEAFYTACDVQHAKPIQACPNYANLFPDRFNMDYIEALEFDLGCTGVCKLWARPLFDKAADPSVRCADTLASHIVKVAIGTGWVTIAVGVLLVAVGVCLSAYDHL